MALNVQRTFTRHKNCDENLILKCLVSQFWPRPIFRVPYGKTIVGAKAFHFSVRNGKRWFHLALMTRIEKLNSK